MTYVKLSSQVSEKGEQRVKETPLCIVLGEKAEKEMEEVRKKLGVSTKVDVLRKALALLNFVTKEEDNIIIIENVRLNVRREVTVL